MSVDFIGDSGMSVSHYFLNVIFIDAAHFRKAAITVYDLTTARYYLAALRLVEEIRKNFSKNLKICLT